VTDLIAMAADKTQDLPRAGDDLHRSASRSPRLLAEISSDHLVDELVTLLLRSHSGHRDALARALDRMISEKILETCNNREDLRNAARKIVEEELGAQGDDQGAR
jgi:predicted nucleic acid-binding protein